jgi:hypothetical protein
MLSQYFKNIIGNYKLISFLYFFLVELTNGDHRLEGHGGEARVEVNFNKLEDLKKRTQIY